MPRLTLYMLYAIALAAVLGIADALYLTASYYTETPLVCSVLEGCNVVAQSPYSVLFGLIPLSLLGVGFYVAVLAAALFLMYRPERIVYGLLSLFALLGFLASLYFVYLQLFVINAICIYCMISAALSTLILSLSVPLFRSHVLRIASHRNKVGRTLDGKPLHYSVGALIRRGSTYLLIDRVNEPLGWAAPAGHVDEGEDPATAVVREVAEETGLKVVSSELVGEAEFSDNWCHEGITNHYWYVYSCVVEGDLAPDPREVRSTRFVEPSELKTLRLEPTWKRWFEKLGML